MLPLPPNRKITAIGDFVADLICTIPMFPVEAGEHQLADSIEVEPGGSGSFTLAARRLGLDVSFLGVMGKDPFGSVAAKTLEREGVDTSGLVCQPDGSTTKVIVLVDPTGRHVYLGKYGNGPEVKAPLLWNERLQNSAALFVSGYSLRDERLTKATIDCLEFSSAKGVPIFFDPGPHIQGLPQDLISKVLGLSRVLLLTEEEISLVLQGKSGLDEAGHLLDCGPEMICIKRGAQGCVILTRSNEFTHGGFPVEVRDSNAAGDSFAAAFIYGFLCGWSLSAIAAFANAMGAAKVKKLGSGTQVPTLDEVLAVLGTYNEQSLKWMVDNADKN